MLALTGALAAACFVKAFGITFLAQPRSAARGARARGGADDAGGDGSAGGGVRGAGAVSDAVLGLLDPLTEQLTGQQLGTHVSLANGWCWRRCTEKAGTISTIGMVLMAVCLLPIPLVLWLVFGRKAKTVRRADMGLRAARVDAADGVHRRPDSRSRFG